MSNHEATILPDQRNLFNGLGVGNERLCSGLETEIESIVRESRLMETEPMSWTPFLPNSSD